MHPSIELLLNPFAGAAGFNLVSWIFYFWLITALVGLAISKRKF